MHTNSKLFFKFKLLIIILITFSFILFSCDGNQTTINQDAPSLIIENGDSAKIIKGETLTLNIIKENIDGIISFSSSNEEIATISNTGVIKALNVGECVISAYYLDIIDTIKISVYKPSINILNEDNLVLNVGDSLKLDVKISESNEAPTFSSSDNSIISVSEEGVIKALSEGNVIISAFISGAIDTISVNVIKSDTPSLIVTSNKDINVEVGNTFGVFYQTYNYSGEVYYEISNLSVIRFIEDKENAFYFEAIGEGDTEITILLDDIYFPNIVTISVHVSPKVNTYLNISIDENAMLVGENKNINIDIYDEKLIDKISYEITEGNDRIDIKNNRIYAKKSGFARFFAKIGDLISNEIELYIYDFDIYSSKNEISVGERIIITINDESIDKSSLYLVSEENNVISLYYDNRDDLLYLEGLSDGETSFYLVGPNNLISNKLNIVVNGSNPYLDISKEEFYSDYKRATSYKDAMNRSEAYLMSGSIDLQDQEPTIASYQPSLNGKLIHNSSLNYYNDGLTYTVNDSNGNPAFDVYFGAAYTSLEEVAAYIYAFGDVPINYSESKNMKPSRSPWGEFLRLNNSEFSGDTDRYPYEPVLPNISGCGGNLIYYEIDIGTTGTDCDPSYKSKIYNDGYSITRGAARIVYSRYYKDTGKEVNMEDRYVFYTYNHYNDFQEYLNYEFGWGEMFGNITGGGEISSKVDYNPTPYVETLRQPL